MNILVCIKQVPGTNKVEIDESTGVLKRSGVESKMNPYDLYALEAALRLREAYGGAVSVVSMGPPQAMEVIRESFAMGADCGTLLSDKAFAGADVLATAKALSACIGRLGGFDLIICGKQTTDGDTAQVGPEIAEFLDIPHVTNVTSLISSENGVLRIEADMGDYIETLDVCLPCLISVDKGANAPRLPSYKKKLASINHEITVVTLADLPGADPLAFGLNGSPTQVERVFPPEAKTTRSVIDGTSNEAADGLLSVLRELKFV